MSLRCDLSHGCITLQLNGMEEFCRHRRRFGWDIKNGFEHEMLGLQDGNEEVL
jgi:hypothetical protein